MNYLALVQRAWLECGASGTSPGPSTVAGQVGSHARLVAWVADAWNDIQTVHNDWGWMRSSASFNTVAQLATYVLGSGAGSTGVTVATFGAWAPDTARNYVTATGTTSELKMPPIDYDTWRDVYQFGGTRAAYSRPYEFAIGPVKEICLGPVPIVGYTVTMDYFTAPIVLSADSDTPALPTKFHMAVVYAAMMKYGAYESAPEVYDRGEKGYKMMMAGLELDRLPMIGFAGALA